MSSTTFFINKGYDLRFNRTAHLLDLGVLSKGRYYVVLPMVFTKDLLIMTALEAITFPAGTRYRDKFKNDIQHFGSTRAVVFSFPKKDLPVLETVAGLYKMKVVRDISRAFVLGDAADAILLPKSDLLLNFQGNPPDDPNPTEKARLRLIDITSTATEIEQKCKEIQEIGAMLQKLGPD